MAYNFSTQTSGECTMIPRPQSPMLWTPSECSTTTGVLSFESDFNMSETDASSELSSNDDTQIPECSTSTRAFSSESTSSAFDLVADTEMQEPENSTPHHNPPPPQNSTFLDLILYPTTTPKWQSTPQQHNNPPRPPTNNSGTFNNSRPHPSQQKKPKQNDSAPSSSIPRHRTPDLIPTTTICVEKSRSRSYGNVEKDRRMRVYLLRTAEFNGYFSGILGWVKPKWYQQAGDTFWK